ncbi:MerR family transcriptional regulator [Cryptosporangium arvum]|uniref:MerR family transcriptional regulator n=1 Tax=Cryptosporangium arvum TaxID=80871 RepID=UPI0004B4D484|nr:MerR family transcriptional regulator [Cryptosporangium arvum]
MNLLTIGQLAAYAGVTIKAVRHYHARGLLPEPGRDASGYRRYGAAHAVALVKIKTLADAGVPLARVGELLAADAGQLRNAVAEIDRSLDARIAELQRARTQIARLESGDRLFVPARCDAYLRRLRALGISERSVTSERDVWILLRAVSPETADRWVDEKTALLDDREFRGLYLEYDAAFDWDPADPRLPDLAARTRAWLAGQPPEDPGDADLSIAALAANSVAEQSPAWLRLAALLA